LLHVKDVYTALSNLEQALKPGGILFIEEPDFRTAFPAASETELGTSIARVNQAVLSMYSSMGIDPALGSKLPSMLLDAALITWISPQRFHLPRVAHLSRR
jgi:2-polyprenyl-3-methyl-5-hydroxy-6-metoxy-1,4-benzoquinol methylase